MKRGGLNRWVLLAGLLGLFARVPGAGPDFDPLPLSPSGVRVMALVVDPEASASELERNAPLFRGVLNDWTSTAFYERVRERDPLGSYRFMELCLRLDLGEGAIRAWAEMMPEPAIWEYALLAHSEDPGRMVARLGRNVPNMEQALDIVLRREYRDLVPEGFWPAMALPLRDSILPHHEAVSLLRCHEPLPAGLLNQAETLMQTSTGAQQWTGLYLIGSRRGEAGATLADLAARGSRNGIRDIERALEEVEMEPEEWFRVAEAVGWWPYHRSDTRDVYEKLIHRTAPLGDAFVLAEALRQPRNVHLLRALAEHRPRLRPQIGESLLRGLKEDFTPRNLQLFAVGADITVGCPAWLLDREWLACVEQDQLSPIPLFEKAAVLRVEPDLVWRTLMAKWRGLRPEIHWRIFRASGMYVLRTGDRKLAAKVLRTLDGGEGFPFDAEGLKALYLDTYGEAPPGAENEWFQLELAMIRDSIRIEGPNRLIRAMWAGRVLDEPVVSPRDFHRRHRADILRTLETGEGLREFIPALCILSMHAERRGVHAEALARGARRALALPALPADERYALALAGLGFGLEDPLVDRTYVEGLANPEVTVMPTLWLNASHARLLPELLWAYDQRPDHGTPLLAALMIDSAHPGVERRVREALLQGADHGLACTLADRLALLGRAPPLGTFSRERLDWLIHADTRESFESLVTFLHSLEAGELDRMLAMMLPKFDLYAEAKPSKNLGVFFRDSPERQRRAADTLVGMLGSNNPHHQDFAARNLATFDHLAPDDLRTVGERLADSSGRRNLHGDLLLTVDGMGAGASFLAETVAELVPSVDPLNRGLALRCLANITADPAVSRGSLRMLISMYEETLNTSNGSTFGQSGLVAHIGAVRGRDDIVVPFLRSVVESYLNPEPSQKVASYSADRAVWALARRSGKEDLFTYCRELLRRMPDDPRARKLSRPVLWCLVNHYEPRLSELRPELDNLPFTGKLLYPYRKIVERLPPRSP